MLNREEDRSKIRAMVVEVRYPELDRNLTEVGVLGGQVWVEGKWREKRILLCHRTDPGGKLKGIMVLAPGEKNSGVVRELALILKKHWDGEIVSAGMWAGVDYVEGRPTITSYYYIVDPSGGRRADQGVGNMYGIVRHYGDGNGQPTVVDPRIVGVDFL